MDAMREAMTPAEFDRWIAYRQIHPDKLERLITVCKLGFALVANAWGAKVDPRDLDPEPQPEPVASPSQAAAIVRMAMGAPDGNSNR